MSAKPVSIRRETPEEIAQRQAEDLARVGNFIAKLQEKGYFGKVTLSFQNGRIIDLRTEQVLKVDDLG